MAKLNKLFPILIALLVSNIMAVGFLEYRYLKQGAELEKTANILQEETEFLLEKLAQITAERNDFEQKYIEEKSRMDSLSAQIAGIQGNVSVLQRLSQTDPELLQKYSKIYFLNENYIPKTLIQIPPDYTFDLQKEYLFYQEIWSFLQSMMISAENAGVDIKIISAYRSFNQQADSKTFFKVIYGSGANAFSADQGYSEHQLGTTIDFTTETVGATYDAFDKTPAYAWLKENAYRYGFVLSYPEDNQYYIFEPWHWRFVGRSLATKLHQEGKYFYDLDQREIDQYLISFFD